MREGDSECGGEVRESLWEAESDSFINYKLQEVTTWSTHISC